MNYDSAIIRPASQAAGLLVAPRIDAYVGRYLPAVASPLLATIVRSLPSAAAGYFLSRKGGFIGRVGQGLSISLPLSVLASFIRQA